MQIVSEISKNFMASLPSCPQAVVDAVKQKHADALSNLTSGSLSGIDTNSSSGYYWSIFTNETSESFVITAKVSAAANRTKMLVYNAVLSPVGSYCENLTFTGSEEVAKKCSEGPFEASLLSQVCKDSYLPTLAKAVGAAVLGFALYKAMQNYRAGEGKYALGWLAAGVTAAISSTLV